MEISGGSRYVVKLRSDGRVVAVSNGGGNTYGKCNTENWRNIVQISNGYVDTIRLESDDTVVAVGYANYSYSIKEWRDIIAIAAGNNPIVGLKSNGTVVATGNNSRG